MRGSDSILLRRLFKQSDMAALLQQTRSLMPGVEVALLETDSRLFVGTGDWPIDGQGRVIASDAAVYPLLADETPVGGLVCRGPADDLVMAWLHTNLSLLVNQAVGRRDLARETLERYRELNLLYTIGDTISACLDAAHIPELVLAQANTVIRADAGVVMLPDGQTGQWTVQAHLGRSDVAAALRSAFDRMMAAAHPPHAGSAGMIERPAILSDLPDDVLPLVAMLYAPLKAQDRILGGVLLGRVNDRAMFMAQDEKLLVALAGQAAIAIENARLFSDLKRQRDAIAAIKNYMDNIFASIASGVVTTDADNAVITINRAAEHILEINADQAVGQVYVSNLPGLGDQIVPLIDYVRRENQQVIGYELQPRLPGRGPVVLRLHISPLKDSQSATTGVAIVVDDLTERRQLEQQMRQVRQTFERYVAPRVVERLLSDPNSVHLGGVRHELTTLFADIRNFSAFTEKEEPERLVQILNQHLTLAAQAVLDQEGTLDKFMGDAVMALFNAPLPQPNHVQRAVRAALSMQRAIAAMHAQKPPDEWLSFGVGIATGTAIVGNIGSTAIRNYTAIGDSVNMAQRLQALAQPGQILLNAAAFERVRPWVVWREIGLVHLKGHTEPDRVFEVLAWQEPEAEENGDHG